MSENAEQAAKDLHVEINYQNIAHSDAIDDHVIDTVRSSMLRFATRLTRVEVHLGDENSPQKSGANDMRCMLEARPAGKDPIAVEEHAEDLYAAIKGASRKLQRALEKRLDGHG